MSLDWQFFLRAIATLIIGISLRRTLPVSSGFIYLGKSLSLSLVPFAYIFLGFTVRFVREFIVKVREPLCSLCLHRSLSMCGYCQKRTSHKQIQTRTWGHTHTLSGISNPTVWYIYKYISAQTSCKSEESVERTRIQYPLKKGQDNTVKLETFVYANARKRIKGRPKLYIIFKGTFFILKCIFDVIIKLGNWLKPSGKL